MVITEMKMSAEDIAKRQQNQYNKKESVPIEPKPD